MSLDSGEHTFGVLTKLDLMDKGTSALNGYNSLPASSILSGGFQFLFVLVEAKLLCCW
jgi:hypothetical protein